MSCQPRTNPSFGFVFFFFCTGRKSIILKVTHIINLHKTLTHTYTVLKISSSSNSCIQTHAQISGFLPLAGTSL